MADRDVSGRFVPGNQASAKINGGNGGRPRRAVEERLLSELRTRLDCNGTLATILDKVIDEAKGGKEWAIRFIFEYMVGRPIQRTESKIALTELLESWASGDISTTNQPLSN